MKQRVDSRSQAHSKHSPVRDRIRWPPRGDVEQPDADLPQAPPLNQIVSRLTAVLPFAPEGECLDGLGRKVHWFLVSQSGFKFQVRERRSDADAPLPNLELDRGITGNSKAERRFSVVTARIVART
jgi:hypothetical protein